jgi:hypothetical protein
LGFGRAGRPRKGDDADAGLDIDPSTQHGGVVDPQRKALKSGIDTTK